MTAPTAHEPSAPDRSEHEHSCHEPRTAAEIERLRAQVAAAHHRLTRQQFLLDQLDHQLAEARGHATAQGIAAHQAERRVAELDRELAKARAELEGLRALATARDARIIAEVEDHHRSLVASLRIAMAPIETPGDHTETATDPTMLALRHWLTPDGALLIVDGDALAAALAPATGPQQPDTADVVIARRSAAVAALRTGLQAQAARSAIVFDGSVAPDAPTEVLADPRHAPRVLVTAPGVDVTDAVEALIARPAVGTIVLAHDGVAASVATAASYRLGVDALAAALT